MDVNALGHQLKAQSPEQCPHQAFWTLRRRMFAQVFAAVLPLIALSIYQTRPVSTIVTEMNAALSASQLSLQATRLEQLQAQQPSEDVQSARASIAQIRAALAVSTSIKTLMPLRGEINAASNAIKAADARVPADLTWWVDHQKQTRETRLKILIGSTVIIQVATTVGDLDEMTRENSVFVQKAEQASADVRQRAADPDAAVGQFKLTGTEAKVPRRAQRAPRPAAAIAANRPLAATGKLLARRQAG
jgi:hypothetical protein